MHSSDGPIISIDRETIKQYLYEAVGVGTSERPPNTYTRRELYEITGMSKHNLSKALDLLIEQGRVKQLKVVADYNGRQVPVPAYQFKG